MRQHLLRLSIFAILATGVAAILPTSLRAQVTGPAEAKECQANADAARKNNPGRTDIESLSPCVVSGGPALVTLWSRHSALSAEQRSALRYSSIKLRDGRLYNAVRSVAGDPSRPTADRLTALQILASYFQPDLVPSVKDLLDPTDRGSAGLPTSIHVTSRDGSTPLPPGRMSEIPAQLARLAWGDPDSNIRAAALKLRQYFAYGHPDVTPLKVGAITLTARCGRSVILASKADVGLPVVLHSGSSQPRTFALKGASLGGQPSEMLLAVPRGPVVATVGGHEVARLTDRNAPCKPGEPRT